MLGFSRIALALGALLPAIAAVPTASNAGNSDVVPDKYIVTYKDGLGQSDIDSHLSWLSSLLGGDAAQGSDSSTIKAIEKSFGFGGFNAYAGTFAKNIIEEIKQNDAVASVEPDHIMHTASVVSQDNAPWGLGRISHRKPGSTTYEYDDKAGAGSYAYVVDCGVFAGHKDFEGRVTLGYNAVPGTEHVDTVGHGTHVAGTIGSKTYGVAKKTNLISVKVFKGESGQTSAVLDGLQWAIKDITSKKRQKHAVINMSLGGLYSPSLNAAAEQAVKAGVTLVAAAGNNGLPAFITSPGSVPGIVTVGATDKNDSRAYFSSWGDIDIFAPGVDILSTWIGSPDATKRLDGTSMASPHVAGLVAYLSSLEDLGSPADVSKRLNELATKDGVTLALSPNRLAFNGISK